MMIYAVNGDGLVLLQPWRELFAGNALSPPTDVNASGTKDRPFGFPAEPGKLQSRINSDTPSSPYIPFPDFRVRDRCAAG
jgi:hypothetical protein